MHYAAIVVRFSQMLDLALIEFVEVVFFAWWNTILCKVFVYLCVWTLTGVYEKYYVKRSRPKRKNGKKAKTNKKNKTKKKSYKFTSANAYVWPERRDVKWLQRPGNRKKNQLEYREKGDSRTSFSTNLPTIDWLSKMSYWSFYKLLYSGDSKAIAFFIVSQSPLLTYFNVLVQDLDVTVSVWSRLLVKEANCVRYFVDDNALEPAASVKVYLLLSTCCATYRWRAPISQKRW